MAIMLPLLLIATLLTTTPQEQKAANTEDFKYHDLGNKSKIDKLQSDHDDWIGRLSIKLRKANDTGNNNEFAAEKEKYKKWLASFAGKKVTLAVPLYKVDKSNLQFSTITKLNKLDIPFSGQEQRFIEARFQIPRNQEKLDFAISYATFQENVITITPKKQQTADFFKKLTRDDTIRVECKINSATGVFTVAKSEQEENIGLNYAHKVLRLNVMITGSISKVGAEVKPAKNLKAAEEKAARIDLPPKDTRTVWINKNGLEKFEWVEDKVWKGTSTKGVSMLEEVDRNSDFIELQRADKLRIRLHDTISYWGGGDHGDGAYLWKENLAPGDSRGAWKKQ